MTGPGAWQKSSYSGEGDGNNCLEVKAGSRGVHLRESDTPATVLTAAPAALAHLLEALRRSALS
ncbi:DUF397 domain-containing protein [Streptomyces sp. NPDC086091]|uniref:DUF397 domain-containing protein n=1 Tax=Streptomyces sp. NPDC086091 TaxID=3365751 RepID=UPI00380E83CB